MLRKLLSATTALRRDPKGVTQPEYAILLGIIILGAGVSVPQLRDGVRDALDAVRLVQDTLPGPGAPPGPGGGLVFSYAPATPFMPDAVVQLAPAGGPFPPGVEFTSEDLPAGFALDRSTGLITRTGTASGKFAARVALRAPDGRRSTATVAWEVLEEGRLTYPNQTQTFVAGRPIEPMVPDTNLAGQWLGIYPPGGARYPTWLAFSGATGVITGTPHQAGEFEFEAIINADDGRAASTKIRFTVQPAPPAVTGSAAPASGVYGAGQTLQLAVTFDQPVTVTGTPQVALLLGSNGGTTRTVQAQYAAQGSTPTRLEFRYTVQPGDSDSDGVSLGALSLNGGSITGEGGPAQGTGTITWAGTGLVRIGEPAGAAFAWGNDSLEQLGDGAGRINQSIPVSVMPPVGGSSLNFVQVSAGFDHSCGVTEDGRGWCWGNSWLGKTGDGAGTGARIAQPTEIVPPQNSTTRLSWKQIVAGSEHSCGLTQDGAAWCWGSNALGQLGIGSTAGTEARPVLVHGLTGPSDRLRFQQITTGTSHTCGLTEAGLAYCWGNNGSGQAGNGAKTATLRPTAMRGPSGQSPLTFASISAGSGHTCGVTPSGQGYCVGAGSGGQLGSGSLSDATVPLPVVAPSGSTSALEFRSISAGSQYSCGTTVQGAGYCWGWGNGGVLGYSSASPDNPRPRLVEPPAGGAVQWATISANTFSCGVTTDGRGYCWGSRSSGRIGDGSTSASALRPTLVRLDNLPPGARWKQISPGASHALSVIVQH